MSAARPLLAGKAAAHAREAVGAIARDLGARCETLADPSLAGGLAGLAVCFEWLARAMPEHEAACTERAQLCLERAVAAVAEQPLSPGLFGGFTGVGWAMAHLLGGGARVAGDDDGGEDAFEAVDAALAEHVAQAPWQGDYDLVSGLVGIGVYALERGARHPAARALAGAVLDHLAALAQRSDQGVRWYTPPELLPPHQQERYPAGCCNLGVAHGVPGVLALLGRYCAAGIDAARAGSLLRAGAAWLRTQRLADATEACFGAMVAPGAASGAARAAWCYGDPGVAVALGIAAAGLGDAALREEARALALLAAARSHATSGVQDAGLCHGAAGLGVVFLRLHGTFGDAALADAARRWFERALAYRVPGEGIGGFRALSPAPDGRTVRPVDDPSLLTGAAGVALGLLAALTGEAPEWDRLLLLSDAG
jgi:hypothetical protein